MKFRPCIDLHEGVVKQIVGGTLSDAPAASSALVTNFVATLSAADYATMYREAGLPGGHVIMLGHNEANLAACTSALAAYPGGLQVGGGINASNAASFIAAGASHVIITSAMFSGAVLDYDKVREVQVAAGGAHRLVLDLSCRRRPRAPTGFEYVIVTNKWSTWTDAVVDAALLSRLGGLCSEFLVHGVDVEGLRSGVEEDLIALLGEHSPIPVTYAGGVRDAADIDRVKRLGRGRVDVTIGSALDIFGGSLSFKSVLAAVDEVLVEHEEGVFRSRGWEDAILQYSLCDGGAVMDLYHTYVPDAWRGKGVAAKLAAAACEYAKERGMTIRPSCSYIRDTFIPRNEGYKHLLVKE